MMRLFILFTLCLTLFANLSNAQEICNNNFDDDGDGLVDCLDGACGSKVCEICDNGIDDDGDYFIDCYDKECSLNSACDDFFLGKDAVCNVEPDSFPPFQMRLKYKSNPDQTNHMNRIIAGDIDGDGMPELVTTYAAKTGSGSMDNVSGITASKINVFSAPASGATLNLETSINVTMGGLEAVAYEDIAMADIDRDGCAEIFVVTKNLSTSSNLKVVAYDCNGNQVWTSPISFLFDPGLIGLADFDHDGLVELYSRTQIFDAHTGRLLGNNNIDNVNTGIHTGVNKGWGMNSNAPIAVDILPEHQGLELVAGCRIYGVTINRGTMNATVTLLREYPQYATRTSRIQSNPTSVADFNQDGFLDVLAVGSDGAYDDNTTIFFWDIKNDNIKKYIDPIGTSDYAHGWKNGAGRINIADIDGDTLLDAVYVSGRYMYAIKEGISNLQMSWRQNVVDETSGFTACTMFDFNGDGKTEIVYRDEDYLYVYHTETNGVVIRSTPIRCSSRSHQEFPIVVDMDGDGSTELCVTCSTTNTTNGKNLGMWDQAELRVYQSANVPWMPARKVWNQHAYFGVNVNDDLTIPREQQLHHLVYAKNPVGGTIRPLNSFLNQTTYLNTFGLPSFPTANLAIVPASPAKLIDYTPFTCLDDSVQVTFKYTNQGDIGVNGTLQISFYDGDPRLMAPLAKRLDTQSISVYEMNPGDTIATTTNLKSQGKAFDLYIVINDNGTTIPLDFNNQPGHLTECDYDNVINAQIIPNPAPLVPEIIQNNLTCLAIPGVPVKPNNGAVKAYASIGNIKDSTNFNFYWSVGTTAKPIASADFIGSNYTNLESGTYTVYGEHKTVNCSSDTVTVVVDEVLSQVDVSLIFEKEYDNSETPKGELRVVVNDLDDNGIGDPESNFNYTWYGSQDILVGDTLGTSHLLTGLDANTYSVLVFDKNTSCYDSAYVSFYARENISIVPFSLTKSVDYTPFTCAADSAQVTFKYTNLGDNALNGTLQISFYDGDPTLQTPFATQLDNQSILLSEMNPGDTITVTTNIKNPHSAFDLYIVVNNNGTTIPLKDISLRSGHIAEYGINVHIMPNPVSLVPELIRHNLMCLTVAGVPITPDRGAVKAYALMGNERDSTSFNFYWSIGSTAKPIASADYIGQTYTGLGSGTYTVYAVHKTSSCDSDTVSIGLGEVSSGVDARIILEKNFDNFENPNGALRAVVNDLDSDGAGDPHDDFNYTWYGGQDVLIGDILGTSHIITSLGAGTFSVLVSDKATGCYDSAYATINPKENVLSSGEDANLLGVSLYPNPGTENFTILIDNGYIGDVQLQLQSVLGNEVDKTFFSHKRTRTLQVPVETLSLKPGVYLVKISLGKGMLRKKWIKL